MEIGLLIITVIDWLYLAVKDPHHPPTHQDHHRGGKLLQKLQRVRRASSLPMSQPPGQSSLISISPQPKSTAQVSVA